MNATRIDTMKLKAAVEKSNALLDQVNEILKPYLLAMEDRERLVLPRVRQGFEPAARAMAANIVKHPELANVAGFDSKAVSEDLETVNVLQAFADKLHGLTLQVTDTKLSWLVHAWLPTAALTAAAEVRVRLDRSVREVAQPITNLFKKTSRKPTPSQGDGQVIETTATQQTATSIHH